MSATRCVYVVCAPAEGDGPEDAVDWYFRRRVDAEVFADNAREYEFLNPDEGPYFVQERRVSCERYREIRFTKWSAR